MRLIYGEFDSKEWASKSDATMEVMEAAKDHLYELLKQGDPSAYVWILKSGGRVSLMLKKEDTHEAD